MAYWRFYKVLPGLLLENQVYSIFIPLHQIDPHTYMVNASSLETRLKISNEMMVNAVSMVASAAAMP